MYWVDIFIVLSFFISVAIFAKTCVLCFGTPKIHFSQNKFYQNKYVDLLVPIRNEVERGLKDNLSSIVSNCKENVNVIAIDDRSDDGSDDVIYCVSKKYNNKIKYIQVTEKPLGWMGKIYALHQGKVSGCHEWVALVDSDVFVKKDIVNYALEFSIKNNLDALCLLPKFEYKSFWVGVVMPSMIWLSGLRASPLQTNSKKSSIAFGFGNFILFKRCAHDSIGGFNSYKSSVLDDCEVMERLKSGGFNVCVADGSDHFSSHM